MKLTHLLFPTSTFVVQVFPANHFQLQDTGLDLKIHVVRYSLAL